MKKVLLIIAVLLTASGVFAAEERPLSDDPARFGVSAKTLGMGRAFVAVADDVNAVFYNPAGLAQINRFQAMTMSDSSLWLGELQYTTGAFALPLWGYGTFGVGIISKRIDEIPILAPEARDINGRPDHNQVSFGAYDDNTTYFSYGLDIGTPQQLDFFRNLSLGITYKELKKTGLGESEYFDSAIARGHDFDLGLRSNITEELSVGFMARNAASYIDPYSAGSLKWNTGTAEGIMGIYTLGMAAKMYDNKFIFAADVDYFERQARPNLGHFGVQWQAHDYLYLRTGIDQLPLPYSNKSDLRVANIVPVGVGLTYAGWEIDYAYYPAYQLEEAATHFISFAYLGIDPSLWPKEPTAAAMVTEDVKTVLTIDTVPNQKVTYEAALLFKGIAEGYKTVEVAGSTVPVKKNVFTKTVTVSIGQNDLEIKTADRSIKRRVLRLPTAEEVRSLGLENNLEYVLTLPNFVSFYQPEQKLSRRKLSEWIAAAKGIQLNRELKEIFSEVDFLTIKGYIDGGGKGISDPDELMTRGTVAVSLAYFEGMHDSFLGVPEASRVEHAIALLVQTGQFIESDFYPIDDYIDMHSAAILMSKTSAVSLKIKELTRGFIVPKLLMEPRIVGPGDTVKIKVALPVDVSLKNLAVQIAKDKQLTMKRLSERLYEGTMRIPDDRKKGFYPIIVYAEDAYGNLVTVKDYFEVVNAGSQKGAAALQPFSDNNYLVNVFPKKLQPGTAMRVVVGLVGGSNAQSVSLVLNNGQKVFFNQIDEGVWQGDYTWPSYTPPGLIKGTFYFNIPGRAPQEKVHTFVISGTPSGQAPARMQSETAGINALTKVRAIHSGNSFTSVYAAVGFTDGAQSIKKITAMPSYGAKFELYKTSDGVWQAEATVPRLKDEVYKMKYFIEDVSGQTIMLQRHFRVEPKTGVKPLQNSYQGKAAVSVVPAAVLPAVASMPAAVPKNTAAPAAVPQKVKVIKGQGTVQLDPEEPLVSTSFKISLALESKEVISKVTAVFSGGSVPLTEHNGVWQGKHFAPAQAGEYDYKVYVKNQKGKVWTIKKRYTVLPASMKKFVPVKEEAVVKGSGTILLRPERKFAGEEMSINVEVATKEKIAKITAVFDDGRAELKNIQGAWQGTYRLAQSKIGERLVKLYVKNENGKTWTIKKTFTVEKKIQDIEETKAASNGFAHITIGPDPVRADKMLYLKVLLNTKEHIAKVTAVFENGFVDLKKVSDTEWQGTYRIAKSLLGAQKLKILVNNKKGRVWYFEKKFSVVE